MVNKRFHRPQYGWMPRKHSHNVMKHAICKIEFGGRSCSWAPYTKINPRTNSCNGSDSPRMMWSKKTTRWLPLGRGTISSPGRRHFCSSTGSCPSFFKVWRFLAVMADFCHPPFFFLSAAAPEPEPEVFPMTCGEDLVSAACEGGLWRASSNDEQWRAWAR